MAGYSRQDTANNIANGKVIDADDLDQLKKLSGINIVVADEAASDEPLDV